MTRKLQLLLTALLLLVGVGEMWAQSIVAPTLDYSIRTKTDDSDSYDWLKNATDDGNGEFELKQSQRIFGLHKYTVDNLVAVKRITLVLKGASDKGTDASAIWAFTIANWTASTTGSATKAAFEATTGVAPGTSGTTNDTYLLIDKTNNRSTTDGVQTCNFVIEGESLTKLKNSASGNTFTLLITNEVSAVAGNSDTQRKYYTLGNGTEGNRPYLSVEYAPAVATENTTNTLCETLNGAFDAITSSGSITLYDDITITSRCDVNAKTISVVAATDGISVSSTLGSSLWFLAGNDASILTFGSDDHAITIDGGNVSNSSNTVEAGKGTTTFKNVIFKDCVSTHNFGITCLKGSGKLYLDNVTFDGCTANDGWGVVFAGNNDLYLQNNIEFNNCAAYNIYLENKFARVGDISTTLLKPITVFYKTPSLDAVILSSANGGDKSSLFQLMNENYGIVKKSDHYTDHVITEAYTMTISDAGAATLILPFNAKIPSGVTAYTLNYTAGKSSVKANEVTGGTLSANTPVLLNADAGKYWFINTTNVASATDNDGTSHTVGALTGVYTETTPGEGHYILTNHSGNVGFRRTVATNKVAAYRAYLTADGAGAPEFLEIDFNGNLTGVDEKVTVENNANGIYYNLSGQRVQNPTKGLYIVNGKKVIIK